MYKAALDEIIATIQPIKQVQNDLIRINSNLEHIKHEMTQIRTNLKTGATRLDAVEKTFQDLQFQLEHRALEQRNIIILNLEEKKPETFLTLLDKLISFFHKCMSIDLSESDIECARRIGKNRINRPICVTLTYFSKKMLILESSHLLQGTSYKVMDDVEIKFESSPMEKKVGMVDKSTMTSDSEFLVHNSKTIEEFEKPFFQHFPKLHYWL